MPLPEDILNFMDALLSSVEIESGDGIKDVKLFKA